MVSSGSGTLGRAFVRCLLYPILDSLTMRLRTDEAGIRSGERRQMNPRTSDRLFSLAAPARATDPVFRRGPRWL